MSEKEKIIEEAQKMVETIKQEIIDKYLILSDLLEQLNNMEENN